MTSLHARARALVPVLALLLPLTACGGTGDGGTEAEGSEPDEVTLTVFAAASLTATFDELAAGFEAAHDGVTVQPSYAGSSDLVAQLQSGAPADVFASADTATMDKLVDDDLAATEPVDFATNTLEIAVPPGNPAGISSFADLAAAGLNLVVCAPEVPCGAAAQQVAEEAGVSLSPVSEEQKVTDVLTKVTTGEADAGLVYVTDVRSAGDTVEGIEFPESSSVVNSYPIAVVEGTANAALAQEFIDLVQSDEGRQILRDAGFGPAA